MGFTGTPERPARPQFKRQRCCVVCGFPRGGSVHLPPLGAPADAPPFDHEFVAPEHRRGPTQVEGQNPASGQEGLVHGGCVAAGVGAVPKEDE
ncbi:hypothetical protein [Bordetella genomosp. 11]|uniref:Uncharacterized protein n=1 Tax=Bordetella genomosp. 11 TaxID=1416808 RepID=A0A261UEP7_9BORD|nr:hypothetical protein [Bordetella genomosp. 11]OZI59902.1 hypothetical protein CAL28_10455 [Bordetella genomosp. 11]